MTDREKLIELLASKPELLKNLNISISKLYKLADHLIAHGVTVQEWISVKDGLPDTECLAVSMLTGPAYKEMLVGYVAEASNWDTGYECESDGEILPNVTHWMPLPPPPKGE